MQNEFLFGFAAGVGIESCVSSPVPSVAQRKRLGFAAAEQRRTVRARQQAGLRLNRTHNIKGAPSRRLPWSKIKTADAFLWM